MMASSSKSPSIVFFGNERLATGVTTTAPVLRALIDAGHQIEAVIVSHEPATSRKQRPLEVVSLAEGHAIPVLTISSKEQLIAAVTRLTSPLGVLAAFGRIVPAEVIDHFPGGILNIHPSLLPTYRGSTPIESAILDGASQTGVSIMQLAVAMDAGPVYAQQPVSLTGHESKAELTETLGSLGAQLLLKTIGQLDQVTPTAQSDHATYTKQFTKADGQLDFSKSATQLEREIRAYLGWPGSFTEIGGKSVIVTHAQVINQSAKVGEFFVHENQLAVGCGQQSLLIERLKPAGKREMTSREFLAGNPIV